MWRISAKLHRPFPRQSDQANRRKAVSDTAQAYGVGAPAHVDNPFHFSFTRRKPAEPAAEDGKSQRRLWRRIILESHQKAGTVPGFAYRPAGPQRREGKSTLIKLLAGELEPLRTVIGLAKGVLSSATSPSS